MGYKIAVMLKTICVYQRTKQRYNKTAQNTKSVKTKQTTANKQQQTKVCYCVFMNKQNVIKEVLSNKQ